MSAAAAGSLTGWRGRDPDLRIVTRAVQVTLAACLGFGVFRYVLGDPVLATYACFASLAFGALSQIRGTPSERTRSMLGGGVVGLVLVTAGTFAAVSDVVASLGMLVVGFLVAFAGVGGPRLVGLSNGLQLFYILPCFPPYAPETLGSRLGGLALGVVLLVLADRLLRPDPGPRPMAARLADAAEAVADEADAIARALADPAAPAVEAADATDAAEAAVRAARPRTVVGTPAARSLALLHASLALEHAHERVAACRALAPLAGRAPASAALLPEVAVALRRCAAALAGRGPAPEPDALLAALATFDAERLDQLRRADADEVERRLRLGAGASEAAGAALVLVDAVRVTEGEPVVLPGAASGDGDLTPFWYASVPPWRLVARRIRLHLTPRSVLLQNAVRLAVVLAVARLVAGGFDLSHGFWVLLAALTLIRTSATDTRTGLVPAMLGTLGGAVVAAGILVVVGDRVDVYAVLLPVVLLVGLTIGPAFGPAYGQAGFTVAVAVLFAQLAPATWALAETRLLDVLLGGVLGIAVGLLTWPRGGGGELRRSVAAYLRASADAMVASARAVAGRPGPGPGTTDLDRAARRAGVFAEATFAQYASERTDPRLPEDRLHAAMGLATRALRGGEFLRMRHPRSLDPAGRPAGAGEAGAAGKRAERAEGAEGAEGAELVERSAGEVRAGMLAAAHGLGPVPGGAERDAAVALPAVRDPSREEAGWVHRALADGLPGPEVLRVIESMAWLRGLARSLSPGGPLDPTVPLPAAPGERDPRAGMIHVGLDRPRLTGPTPR